MSKLALSLLLGMASVSLASGAGDPVHGGTPAERFVLQSGDQLRISYPGAPELNAELVVRRDGVATFPIIGEVLAAGKTPKTLESELLALYATELVTNEVLVTVVASTFTFFLEGEIRSPGMIQSTRQLSVLEAIIAGGGIVKETGKLKNVIVIRRKGDVYTRFKLDIKEVLEGKTDKAFILEPYDIVSVPQRIW